ncbi:SDR family oxidoreductase [Alteraurantiacibacter aquimixticola]|uniref:SDR family NAD(P)-dependent oxidoreductase n=1 Tax=Alteraurantiacibacter aquimixticola TaxID=2489173 RepID=A0A4T3F9N8_9SPHN|nr:SDR family NAD(P)-dependent oxidoreductase [Alteraurantiacibacter aquimixticola]TIX51740.1 SDR family NAD(P)-dependent oxidoreductase [Alteraurantiacibacter aquimixticola]
MKLTGNTILVTGGGSGIGQALAWQFADRGNEVIVAGRTLASLEETVAGRDNMYAVVLDVADDASVAACAERLASDFPALNMLIHSAGIMRRDELTGDTIAISQQIIDINLLGTIRMVEALLPQLEGKENAAICTVSSGLAFAPLPSAPAYSASKAAVHSYSLSLRHRLQGEVEVIEIAPPAVQTGLTPGQETREGYMPLDDYIAETMVSFEQQPTPRENLVANVLPLRNAEKEGRMDEVLEMLGNL